MEFKKELTNRIEYVEHMLPTFLPAEEGYQRTLFEAMDYAILAGGKRIRPILMLESYKLFKGVVDDEAVSFRALKCFMAAQEMIHNYSLIHDDLPAMDDDDYRRGRKTTHIVFGEAMAILAGDGLLNYAFETASKSFSICEDDAECLLRCAKAMKNMSEKAGVYGMIGGQAVDVESEKKNLQLGEDTLLFIHEHKTAALIQSSMMIGALLAGADTAQIQKLEKCAYNIGVAFQIQDDILDITSTTEVLGKPVGSDEKNEKLTYVSLHGLEESKIEVERLSKEAIDILQEMPTRNEFLENLVLYMITREK